MLRRIALFASGLLLLALVLDLGAQTPARKDTPKKAGQGMAGHEEAPSRWSIDDVVLTEHVSDMQMSPDGRWAVWVLAAPDEEEGERVKNIYRADLRENRETRMTRGKDNCFNPRWSRDGKMLAFLSDREVEGADDDAKGKTQLWLMEAHGGESWAITKGKRDIQAFAWASNRDIVFLAQEEPGLRERDLTDEKKDDTEVVEDDRHEPPTRLFAIDTDTEEIVRLTDNTDRIEKFALSPGGTRAVAVHGRSLRFTYDNRDKPEIRLHDLEKKQSKRIFKDARFNISSMTWAPDGTGFYATDEYSSQPHLVQAGVTELYYFDLEKDREEKIPLDWPNGLAAQWENEDRPGIAVTQDGFFALLANGVRHKLARYRLVQGKWAREWVEGEHVTNLISFEASRDGRKLLYAHSTASEPTQWYHAHVFGRRLDDGTALAEVNDHLEEKTKAVTEIIRWKGALDEEVEGILYYPHEYEKGKKYPLIVMIHGGPASLDLDSWDETWAYAANLYCQKGAFVFKPNYHGSSNYGLKWLESISLGKYGDLETVDIETGVDHLIARGMVDANKMGLIGWSNGAILINMLTVKTTRYRAAAPGAGTVEYISDWANCEFGDAFDRYYLGKSPLEDPELYIRKSPFFEFEKVTTPTLIFFGKNDRVVPTQQGWVHYRGLQQHGKTEVRLVLFPDAEHSLEKLAHKRRKLKEELAWFDRHLFQSKQEDNLALKKESPLGWELARQSAKRDGTRYGVVEKGALIPETVPYRDIVVGRFEVTRAQFAAFDNTYRFAPGEENLPASGITFEQAKAYCLWLSKTTGRIYRLPNQDDADTLHDDSSSKENTLDHWAGYSINPDDARRLQDRIKAIPGKAPLLKPVGSFGSVGASHVFDVGGNVAEWTVTEDGKGLLKGGSADQPAGTKTLTVDPAPEYRGFRVVVEE